MGYCSVQDYGVLGFSLCEIFAAILYRKGSAEKYLPQFGAIAGEKTLTATSNRCAQNCRIGFGSKYSLQKITGQGPFQNY